VHAAADGRRPLRAAPTATIMDEGRRPLPSLRPLSGDRARGSGPLGRAPSRGAAEFGRGDAGAAAEETPEIGGVGKAEFIGDLGRRRGDIGETAARFEHQPVLDRRVSRLAGDRARGAVEPAFRDAERGGVPADRPMLGVSRLQQSAEAAVELGLAASPLTARALWELAAREFSRTLPPKRPVETGEIRARHGVAPAGGETAPNSSDCSQTAVRAK